MRKKGFMLPMKKSERIFGWMYAVVHIFLLPYMMGLLFVLILNSGLGISEETIDKYSNLIYYGFGFLMILLFMHDYLKATFYDLCDNKFDTLQAVAMGYLFYYGMAYIVALIISAIAGETVNPNNDTVISEFLKNKNIMMAVAAIIAPIVEEVLFRGVIFGTIRRRSRITAYIVSALVFAVYHLWTYLLHDFSTDLLWDLLQYIPGGIALAWTYERAKNLWASIALHIIINFIAVSVSIAFVG